MFEIVLRKADETRRYSVSALADSGWEVVREYQAEPPHHVCYRDWHRVERALAIFQLEVSELTQRGWRVVH
jgi:hypothetical protein